jgi:hypothetical protein
LSQLSCHPLGGVSKKEDEMKTLFTAIIVISILTVCGCSKKENISNTTNNPPENSKSHLVEGIIVAVFIDTVSQVHAESFLLAHNLTVYRLRNFNGAPPHSCDIDVPIGQEEAWIDTLQNYPEIKSVDRLYKIQIP